MPKARSIEASLSVSQKEEVLEILVAKAGGKMVYSSNGMGAGYFLPGDNVATRFTGKEDLIAIAEKANIDIFDIPHEEAKLGGLGKIQNINALWKVLNDAITSAPRKQHGYDDFASHLLSSLSEQDFQLAIPSGSRELLIDVLETPLIRKHLIKTFEQRYTSKLTEALTKAILSSLETMGAPIEHKATAKMAKLKDAFRTDPKAPYKVTVRASLDDFFLRTAEMLTKQDASARVFINSVHRAAAKRNLTFTSGESPDSVWLPVDYMPPQVKMIFVDIYSSLKRGDVENARKRLNDIRIFERPPYHSYIENDYRTMIAERLEGRFHGYVNQISSQLVLAKGIEQAQVKAIEELRDSAVELFGDGKEFVDVMKSLSIVESASKPALYSTNSKNAHHALNLTGTSITSLINEQSSPIEHAALRNKAESFVADMKSKLEVVIDASDDDHIKQRLSMAFDAAFDGNGKLRQGVRPEHAYSLATDALEHVTNEISQNALQSIKARLNRVGTSLEQYSSMEGNESWAGVLNNARVVPEYSGDHVSHISTLERIIVTNELLDTYEKEILPTFSVNTLSKPEPVVEAKAEPLPTESSEPKVERIAAAPAVEIEKSLSDTAPQEESKSNAMRARLREIENTLTDIPFDNEMELVLPDEFDWLNKKWADIVPTSIDDDDLPAILNLASNAFSQLLQRPHRRNMKEWFLHSVELDGKNKDIEIALKSLGQTPGAELMRRVVMRDIAHLYFTPKVINENVSVAQFEKAAHDVQQRVKDKPLLDAFETLSEFVGQVERNITETPEHSMQWKVHFNRCSEMTDMTSPKDVLQLADKLKSSMSSDDAVKFILEQPVPAFSGGEGIFTPIYSSMEDHAQLFTPTETIENERAIHKKIA